MLAERMMPERKLIWDRVSKGTNYIGICAGGYLGAAQMHVKFKMMGQELSQSIDALHLLNVYASGPVYDSFLEKEFSLQSSIRVDLSYQGEKIGEAYYCHGCDFSKMWTSHVNIVASYPNRKTAAVSGYYGIGHVTLFGAHPEYEGHDLGISETTENAENRQKIMETLLTGSGLALKV